MHYTTNVLFRCNLLEDGICPREVGPVDFRRRGVAGTGPVDLRGQGVAGTGPVDFRGQGVAGTGPVDLGIDDMSE